MKNMRLTTTPQEILSVFKYYHQHKKTVLLWQNIKGKREKVPAIVFEYSAKGDIRFLALGKIMSFNPEFPLYIYGEYKSLLFKASARSKIPGELMVSLPKIVRFEEMRKIKRLDLYDIKNCEVGFKKHMDLAESWEFSYKINDLSEAGISFLMGQDSSLEIGDDITITQIQHEKIYYNLNGKVVHISPKVTTEGLMDIKLNKVGIQFKQKLKMKELYLYKKVIKGML